MAIRTSMPTPTDNVTGPALHEVKAPAEAKPIPDTTTDTKTTEYNSRGKERRATELIGTLYDDNERILVATEPKAAADTDLSSGDYT